MKVFYLTLCFVLFRAVVFGQALMTFEHPMIDNATAFWGGSYDTALLKKNKVESCFQKNLSFYFDSSGRLVKSVLIQFDSSVQLQKYFYDSRGDVSKTEVLNSKHPEPVVTTNHRTYNDGQLMKDSSSSGYFCKHLEYYENGSLRQELWFGPDLRSNARHLLHRAFWFGIDSLARINRIIYREYPSLEDSVGQLLSNRTLFYNEKGQLIREEEAVTRKENNQKTLFCPNAGTATLLYDEAGNLIEINRKDGPSQRIRYLTNGLITEIETRGMNCEGSPYSWKWNYTYTYYK